MHYLSHQSVDAAYGIVVDVAVTPGNANDSEPYLERIEYMCSHLGLKIKTVSADSAYGTSLICQTLHERGIRLYTPKATGGITYKVEFRREEFKYQQEKASFLCPAGKGWNAPPTDRFSNSARFGARAALRRRKRATI